MKLVIDGHLRRYLEELRAEYQRHEKAVDELTESIIEFAAAPLDTMTTRTGNEPPRPATEADRRETLESLCTQLAEESAAAARLERYA